MHTYAYTRNQATLLVVQTYERTKFDTLCTFRKEDDGSDICTTCSQSSKGFTKCILHPMGLFYTVCRYPIHIQNYLLVFYKSGMYIKLYELKMIYKYNNFKKMSSISNIPSITLIMIVKNEDKIIERCLDSVSSFVDYIVISDTGSTDQTVSVIERYIATHNLCGKVYTDEWKNFGHNRTKSIQNGKHWLTENNIPLHNNYFITIDADMIVVVRPTFVKEYISQNTSWLLEQGNDSIRYYNPRIFRADLDYRCIGVTHEYWTCFGDNSHTINNSLKILDTIYINDRGDGGCKADKFPRDIALLTKGIEEEPGNERYFFYLAESYMNSDKADDALVWYQRRIDAGSWNEEIYISHIKRGELFMSQQKEEHAVYEWLKAYECIPERLESMYRIIQHYRITKQYSLCTMFLTKTLDIIKKNKGNENKYILFIEHPISNYKLAEEYSIIAYYLNQLEKGGKVSQLMLLNKTADIPDYVKHNVLTNSYFYMKPLPYTKHVILDFADKVEEPYRSSSSSLFFDEDTNTIRGNVRLVNYEMNKHFQYMIKDENNIVRTKNMWVDFQYNVDRDENTKFINVDSCALLDESKTIDKHIRDAHIKGIEDIRLCYNQSTNTYKGIGVSWEYGRVNHPSVVYFDLNSDNKNVEIAKIRPLRYKDDICQKNWVPFFGDDNDKMYAIYSHDPFVLLEIGDDKETVVIQRECPFDLSRVRGSSSPIKVGKEGKEWLVITHEVLYRDTRKYYHRFLRYDEQWNLVGISDPFFMKHFYVEFVLSIMYNKSANTVMIPFSTMDNSTEIVELEYDKIKWIDFDTIDNINEFIARDS
jgi:glycosyltransferase involved in cell wall biosynthesis